MRVLTGSLIAAVILVGLAAAPASAAAPDPTSALNSLMDQVNDFLKGPTIGALGDSNFLPGAH
ncbi:hypothetical protein ACFSKW_05455 [Nonomuraea mangrovi]|uniref:Uncharacterized protein n=1 Tax=Nonomuraea mangrovi TaxID=2316207 RepID=A0ABW4SP82_9ACTN